MKACSYCGRESDDAATHCGECGTAFESPPFETSSNPRRWSPHSPIVSALKICLASVLICTGIYCAVGTALGDILRLFRGESKPPGGYLVFWNPPIMWAFFSIGVILFTFFVCRARQLKLMQIGAIVTATLVAIALLVFGPLVLPGLFWIWLFLPVAFLGMITGQQAGIYIGAVLQIFVGASLLGWLRKARLHESTGDP